jgi:hypothetical protein
MLSCDVKKGVEGVVWSSFSFLSQGERMGREVF